MSLGRFFLMIRKRIENKTDVLFGVLTLTKLFKCAQ